MLFSYAGPSFSAPAESTFTFSAAWKTVKAENDALQASQAEVERAGHEQDAAKWLYLPEVDISAAYIHLDDDVELSPDDILDSMSGGDQVKGIISNLAQGVGFSPSQLNSALTSHIADQDSLSSSLDITWPIFTGGRITAAQDIATGQLNEAKFKFKSQLISQFQNLVRYYFGAVLAKQVYGTRVSVEKGLKQHRDNAVLLEKGGQIARVERLMAEASYDKAVVERKKAGRDFEIAQIALSRMLKSRNVVDPTDTLFVADDLPGLDHFISSTMNSYPGLGVLDSKEEQASGLVDLEEGKYLPTVALFSKIHLYEENDLINDLVPDWYVGVGVNFPLMDRSGRSEQVRAAKSTIKQIEHLQTQARSDLSVLVEQNYRHAEQALEEYYGLKSSLNLAKETVNLRNKAFKQGLSTSLDVVDAEMFLAGVKTQRAVAVYNYIVSLGQVLAVSCEQESFFYYQKSNTLEGF